MMPEAAVFLGKAHRCLAEGRTMLGVALGEAAGRSAYLAAFHAAQALIFDREKRVVKTHNGVHTEFQRLMVGAPGFPTALLGFMSRNFRLKIVADYEADPDIGTSVEQARDALDEAARFIAAVEVALAPPPP